MSMHNYLNITTDCASLFSSNNNEITYHLCENAAFTTITKFDLQMQMHNYFLRKRYNHYIGDIVPLATVTVLKVRLAIVTGAPEHLALLGVIQPLQTININYAPLIIVHLNGEHCSRTK